MPNTTKNEILVRMGSEMVDFLKFLVSDDEDAAWMKLGFESINNINQTNGHFVAQINLLVAKGVLSQKCADNIFNPQETVYDIPWKEDEALE